MKFEKLNYDKKINDILMDIYKILDRECSHIFLYGSTSIGKLSYKINGDKVDFYSDIELIVIPKDKKNENNKEYKKKLMGDMLVYIKSNENIGRLPFIDINPVSDDFFHNTQIRISTYELKHNAICLKGENLLESIIDVNPENYNYKIQNIEIVKGLKVLLIESYNFFVNRDTTSVLDFERYNYFLNSSYLNVLRTLLPLYNRFELTIEDRVNAISDLRNDKKIVKYFGRNVLNNFGVLAENKRNCEFVTSSDEFFSDTVDLYMNLLSFILECDNSELVDMVYNKKDILFCGEDWKVEMLADLTVFFLNSLQALKELVISCNLSNEKIELIKKSYDKLLYGENAFEFKRIVEDYIAMEKDRWKIIGSKD